jgi:hypothetical protein
MPSALPRAVLALVAVLLVAWFAVLFRDQRIGQEATDRITRNPDMSDAGWALSLDQLRQAELLNPGTEWSVARANWLFLRDRRGALRLADSVVRSEPDNVDAWRVVLKAARGRDPRRASQATKEIGRLNPSPRGG